MTLATRLTVGRLVMAPLFMVFILRETVHSLWIASILYTLAAVTDGVDGYLARKTGTVTPLGRMLDPLADKLLVGFAYLSFLFLRVPGVELWMVAIILARELLVTWLRSYAGRRGMIIHSSQLAKWKTTFQMVFVFGLLILLCYRASWVDPAPEYWLRLEAPFTGFVYGALVVTTLITLASGLDYLWKNRAAFQRPADSGAA
ncbi:MAG: CDP-diacylglycerol--glycerol-3-phosphate 3-phosphatidyltransferase [Gemmatimonadota bacterium]|nr:MAG: CDP-diacylglycerol--glycerol-3-phosphate 3-phosphatidyltransferase [Gemmatimonadota bacterium]